MLPSFEEGVMMKLSAHWIALFVGGVITTSATLSSALVLDFEDVAPRTRVTTQYAARGVLFVPSAFVQNDGLAARSGMQVLLSDNPATEFNPRPLRIEFTNGQSLVRMFARAHFESITGTLSAFDVNGTLVGQDGPKAVATNAYTTQFQVSVATPTIRRVELLYSSAAFEAIDDLEFQGGEPGPLPTEPPQVQIITPIDNQQFVDATIRVSGTVSGPQVVSPGRLAVEVRRPPESNVPSTSTSFLQLTGSESLKNFSLVRRFELGPQTLTVTAENSAGLIGTHSVQITYLPQVIRGRVASEGENTLGDFQFGGRAENCSYAVYQRGAVAEVGGSSAVVRDQILGKWLSIKDLSGFPSLGCPTSDGRSVPGDAAIAQDFQKARIYADANGVFQVPTVFVQAIEARGGEAATGIPITDPSSSTGLCRPGCSSAFAAPGTRSRRPHCKSAARRRAFTWKESGGTCRWTRCQDQPRPQSSRSFHAVPTSGPVTSGH
jgi:hypothetical protein